MSVRSTVLDILVDARAEGLDAFDAVGGSARNMASDLEAAGSQAESAASRFDGVAGSAENLDDKAGRATGAMGALSSGFALIGADQAAAALEGAAMATDFLSGAGQALLLVMDLEIVKKVTATAATAAQTVATTAQTAASKAAAAGQWALNAALSANPLGVVIALVAGLALAVVVAYRKSDEFREKVDAAMAVARAAFSSVSDAVADVVGWLRDKIPPAFSWIKDKAASVISAAFAPFDAARTLASDFRDFIADKIEPAVTTMKAAVVPVLEALSTPITAAKNAVEDLIGWIAKIDFPSPPDWLGKLVPGGSGRLASSPLAALPLTGSTMGSGADPTVVGLLTAIRDLLTVATAMSSTPVDSSTLARLIADLLRREGILSGAAA